MMPDFTERELGRPSQSSRKWMRFLLTLMSVVLLAPSRSAAEDGLLFGGDDFVVVPHSSSLSPSQLTVECWVNVAVLAGPSNNEFIVSKGNDGTQGSYYLSQNGDQFHFYLGKNGVDQVYALTSSLHVQTNHWYHVAGTYDGTNLHIYVDGDLEGTTPANIAIGNSLELTLGYHNRPGVPYWLSGSLREVRIWSLARTQGEIQATMNQSLVGTEPGLVGYWRLNEASGQVAHDSSGNSNNGQLGSTPDVDTNDPTWIASIPTLSEWGIIGMSLVMFGAVLVLRRRQVIGLAP